MLKQGQVASLDQSEGVFEVQRLNKDPEMMFGKTIRSKLIR